MIWAIRFFGYAAILGLLFLLWSIYKSQSRTSWRHNVLAALCAAGIWVCGLLASILFLVLMPLDQPEPGGAEFLAVSLLLLGVQMFAILGLSTLIHRHWPGPFQKFALLKMALALTLFFFVQTMKSWLL
jgi:hypothetical protein